MKSFLNAPYLNNEERILSKPFRFHQAFSINTILYAKYLIIIAYNYRQYRYSVRDNDNGILNLDVLYWSVLLNEPMTVLFLMVLVESRVYHPIG